MHEVTYNNGVKSDWIPYTLPWNDMPIDLSFLYEEEKPAGKHGFLKAEGDRFVFEDGTEARFWGTLLNAAANFPTHEQSDMLARRLAKVGINMVRTHQMDAEWAVPNIFQATKGKLRNDTRSFDPESLDRFDYLISRLKKEGIYIYLDLLSHRMFKEGDGVEGYNEIRDQEGRQAHSARPYSHIDPKLIELQKEFNHNLWTHVNPYTGLAYKDDPAIALTEIANENNLLATAVGLTITAEPHRTRFETRYRAWAKDKGFTVEEGAVDFANPTPQIVHFLHDVDRDYFIDMRNYLHEIGVKIPVAGTNWTKGGVPAVSSMQEMDFADSHAYASMWKDNGGHNISLTSVDRNRMLSVYTSSVRPLNKPFFISEWDSTWSNEWRGETPLMMAAALAFQGWGGATIHTYRYTNAYPADCMGGMVLNGVGYRLNFDTYNDPAKFGLFYHAALMYRKGHVKPAIKSIGIKPDPKRLFTDPPAIVGCDTGNLAEKHRIGLVLGDKDDCADSIITPEQAAEKLESPVKSDTDEIYRDSKKGMALIDTAMTKAAYGFIGGPKPIEIEPIELDGLTLKVKTPFAVIAISSLTDEPIESSRNLLMTTVGRADNAGAKYADNHTRRTYIGHGPVMIEAIRAEISLRTTRKYLKVWSINPQGFPTGQLPTTLEEGQLSFETGTLFPSMYYLLQEE